jgi:hypothetical protein
MATQPPASPKKSSLTVSRVILVLILVAALVALGYDQFAKYRMGQAYEEVKKMADENEESSVLGLPKAKVREKLGEPTRTSLTANNFQQIEEYDFPGVFYIHKVIITYRNMKDAPYEGLTTDSIFRFKAE